MEARKLASYKNTRLICRVTGYKLRLSAATEEIYAKLHQHIYKTKPICIETDKHIELTISLGF